MADELPTPAPLMDEQDLKDAIEVLRRLWSKHSRNDRLKLMINWIEAEMTYRVDPTSRIIQTKVEPKGPAKR